MPKLLIIPSASEKHCATKLVGELYYLQVEGSLEDIRGVWSNLEDKARLEVLKSVIWTAPDCHEFFQKAKKLLNDPKFEETLD